VLAVNAKSVYLTARHLVPAMKAAGRGAILNIASTAGCFAAPAAQLVQRLEGLDDHRDEGHGGGTGALRHPGQRARPSRERPRC
jgi:NAD(P)-dependent dehydrogenase (short-subunit alcohol dehydrogenase family)